MEDSQKFVASQIVQYSNAVVAFIVLQALSYSYFLGTDCNFNVTVKTASYLAELLCVLFLSVGVLAVFAIRYLSAELIRVVPDQTTVLNKIYKVKMAIIGLFGALPFVLTLFYAVLTDKPNVACTVVGL